MAELNKYAVIVAGGQGTRMQSAIPKQFMELAGYPVLMHTIRNFHTCDAMMKIMVVLPQSMIPEWEKSCLKFSFEVPHRITAGGNTRFHSVQNGLNLVSENAWVAVHDAVRPLASPALIKRIFLHAMEHGNAVPAVALKDSVRQQDEKGNRILNRENLRLVQTPQCFRSDELKEAFRQEYREEFTDEASVMESAGHKIFLAEGDPRNIKITNQEDLIIANALMESQNFKLS